MSKEAIFRHVERLRMDLPKFADGKVVISSEKLTQIHERLTTLTILLKNTLLPHSLDETKENELAFENVPSLISLMLWNDFPGWFLITCEPNCLEFIKAKKTDGEFQQTKLVTIEKKPQTESFKVLVNVKDFEDHHNPKCFDFILQQIPESILELLRVVDESPHYRTGSPVCFEMSSNVIEADKSTGSDKIRVVKEIKYEVEEDSGLESPMTLKNELLDQTPSLTQSLSNLGVHLIETEPEDNRLNCEFLKEVSTGKNCQSENENKLHLPNSDLPTIKKARKPRGKPKGAELIQMLTVKRSDGNKITCRFCNRKTYFVEKAIIHMKADHGFDLPQCCTCGQSFDSDVDLRSHIKVGCDAVGEVVGTCRICRTDIYHRNATMHMERDHGQIGACPFCPFGDLSEMNTNVNFIIESQRFSKYKDPKIKNQPFIIQQISMPCLWKAVYEKGGFHN